MTPASSAVKTEVSNTVRNRRWIISAITVVALVALTCAGAKTVLQKQLVTLSESANNVRKSAEIISAKRHSEITSEKAIQELSILATQPGGGFAAASGLYILNADKDVKARDEWFIQQLFAMPDAERTMIATQYRTHFEDFVPSLGHSMSAEMKAKVESCIVSTNQYPPSWTLMWATFFKTHTSACKL